MKVIALLLLFTSVCFGADSTIVGNIEAVCEASRPEDAWIKHSGEAERTEAKRYRAIQEGDFIGTEGQSPAMILLRYALPTEPPILVTRNCQDRKAQQDCLTASFQKSQPRVFCLNKESHYYTVLMPKADDPLSTKISRLFHEAFSSIVHVEQIDMSVMPQPYRNETEDKNSPVYLIEPRHCPVLSHPHFVWRGPDNVSYTVRVYSIDSDQPVYTSPELRQTNFEYPKNATNLGKAQVYLWEVEGKGLDPQRIQFEIADEGRVEALQTALSLFDAKVWKDYPTTSIALLKAAVFIEQGLYADARQLLLQAVTSDEANPLPHAMLKQIYEKQAMYDLAKEERENALKVYPR